jgi:hypothetical protein
MFGVDHSPTRYPLTKPRSPPARRHMYFKRWNVACVRSTAYAKISRVASARVA